jgi:lysozyme
MRHVASRTLVLTVALVLTATSVASAVRGIDVSRWQHGTSINWTKVEADNVSFTFIKATEGSFYTNDYLRSDWAAARRVGIYRGAYHFARPGRGSARRQARYFVRKVRLVGSFGAPGVLPPVLDLESTGGLGVRALRRWTGTWLRTVENMTGRKPIVYGSSSFLETELGRTRLFASYPLWVAHYTSAPRPWVPEGWRRWTFWQRTDEGRVNGISGAVDINRFNGTMKDLAVLAQAAPPENGGNQPPTGTTPPPPGTEDPETPTDPEVPTEPTPAATAVSLRLSDDTVFRGSQVQLTGRLRTTSGEALGGRRVVLHRRAEGSAWERVGPLTTATTGRYATALTATASAAYRVTWRGTDRYAAATSKAHTLTARPKVRTGLTLAVEPGSRVGNRVKLYGHLTTARDRALTGQTMQVYQRLAGAAEWTLVARTESLSPTGWYQTHVAPRRTATYKAVFRSTTRYARTVSNLTTVRVR